MSTKGERLKTARENAGFDSAEAAAREFGWTVQTYRSHEKAGTDAKSARNFKLEDAQKYGQAFGADGNLIFYGEKGLRQKVVHRRNATLTDPPNMAPRPGTFTVSSKRLTVLGQAIGGPDGRFLMNGEAIEWIMCPPGLENVPGAYAVYVVGDSMEPRYFAGEVVFVHPNKPYRRGNYVVVQIHNTEEPEGAPLGYVKQFISLTPTRLILAQYNPKKELEFDRKLVVSIHRIVLSGDS